MFCTINIHLKRSHGIGSIGGCSARGKADSTYRISDVNPHDADDDDNNDDDDDDDGETMMTTRMMMVMAKG